MDKHRSEPMPANARHFLDASRRSARLLAMVKEIAFGDERTVRAAALANLATMHRLNLTADEARALLDDYLAPMGGDAKAKVVALLAKDQDKLDELLRLEKRGGNLDDVLQATLAKLQEWGIDDLTLQDIEDIYAPLGDPQDPDGPRRGT